MPRGLSVTPTLFIVLMVFFNLSDATPDEARIILLKHRTASDVIPLIRPLLGPDDALTGMDFRLIIRTSDKNLKEIEHILEQVDVARQRLRITVEQASADDRDAASQSVTGEVRVGDEARVTLPAKTSQEDGLIIQKDKLRYSANRHATTTSNANIQTVMTLDGQRAYIRIGQSVPYVKKILALSRHQLALVQEVELQNVTTGFDVLPRVRGDRVLVEITPRLSTLKDPATGLADFQELSTTVESKLGEWLDLGEILGNRGEVQRAILESANTTSGERRTVRLKIE